MPAPPRIAAPVAQHARPAVLRRSGHDTDHAAGVLVVGRARARAAAARTSAASSTCAPAAGQVAEPDVDQAHLAGRARAPRPTTSPALSAPNVTVTSARTAVARRPRRCRRRPRTAGRPPRSASRRRRGRQRGGRRRAGPPRPPMPTMPSTTRSAATSAGIGTGRPDRRRAAARPARRRARARVPAAAPSRGRRAPASRAPAYSASPPLLPAPTSSDDPRAVHPTEQRRRSAPPARSRHAASARPRAAGPSAPSSAARTCSTVYTPCIALTPSDSAITVAEAIPPSCDSDTCQRVTPSEAARSATVPRTASDGRPSSSVSTSASVQCIPPPAPSALASASLAANRAASDSAVRGSPCRRHLLGGGEQPVGQRRRAAPAPRRSARPARRRSRRRRSRSVRSRRRGGRRGLAGRRRVVGQVAGERRHVRVQVRARRCSPRSRPRRIRWRSA